MSGTQHAKGYARDGRVRLLRVQFDDVAICKRMVLPDLLSVEARWAPYPSKLKRPRQILVHESCDVADRLATAQREGPLLIHGPPRGVGIDAHDAEIAEEPRPDLTQTLPSDCGNREDGVTQSRQFAKRLEFRLNVGDAVGLVRKNQRRKP